MSQFPGFAAAAVWPRVARPSCPRSPFSCCFWRPVSQPHRLETPGRDLAATKSVSISLTCCCEPEKPQSVNQCTGHTRKISIPDCVEFHITTNACRGFCESWAVPSELETLRANPHQAITSVGQCCNIMDTEDVSYRRTGLWKISNYSKLCVMDCKIPKDWQTLIDRWQI